MRIAECAREKYFTDEIRSTTKLNRKKREQLPPDKAEKKATEYDDKNRVKY